MKMMAKTLNYYEIVQKGTAVLTVYGAQLQASGLSLVMLPKYLSP